MITVFQAEHLVQMICYPGGLPSVLLSEEDDDDEEPEQRRHISRILHHVDQWSLRVSWLELQLMLKQASSSVSFTTSVSASSFQINANTGNCFE